MILLAVLILRHLTMLTVCVHVVFVVMVTRTHVGTHMLHARIHGALCTLHAAIQEVMLIRTGVRKIHAVEFGEEQSQGV